MKPELLYRDGGILQINGKGFLLPQVNTATRTTITATLGVQDRGLLIYNITTNQIQLWTGTSWAVISPEFSGSGYPGTAALRARDVYVQNQIAYLIYAAQPGDNGGGWFVFDAASTAADDGVDVIKPDAIDVADPGRWLRNS